MQVTEYCLQGTLAHAFSSKIRHALGNSEEGEEVCTQTIQQYKSSKCV